MANIGRHRLVELEGGLPQERGMVRAGGSASRIIGDQGTTDPGGGDGGSRSGRHWQLLVGRGLGPSWASSSWAG